MFVDLGLLWQKSNWQKTAIIFDRGITVLTRVDGVLCKYHFRYMGLYGGYIIADDYVGFIVQIRGLVVNYNDLGTVVHRDQSQV